MNRRSFISAIGGGSVVASQTATAVPTKPQEQRALSSHLNASMKLLQYNMQRSASWDFENHTEQRIAEPDQKIIDDFPKYWMKLKCLDVVGVQVACGPTGIMMLENGGIDMGWYTGMLAPRIFSNGSEEINHDEVKRCLEIQTVERAQTWNTTERYLSPFAAPYRLDSPNIYSMRLRQASYCVRSHVIPSPEEYAQTMDNVIFKTMFHIAVKDPSKARAAARRSHAYTIINPLDAKRFDEKHAMVITSDAIERGWVVVGFKESEYHASLYWMPYVPIQRLEMVSGTKYKTRYGLFHQEFWKPWFSDMTIDLYKSKF